MTDTLRPNAKQCMILEQILEDPVTNLTIKFEKRSYGGCSIQLFKTDPNNEIMEFGNRDLGFDENGEHSDAGTALSNCRQPSFIKEVQLEPEGVES